MLKIDWGEDQESPDTLKTPSLSLNHAMGGGVWTDRLTSLWGNEGAGKSTLLANMGAEAQLGGFKIISVDSEGTYTDEWEEKCGIDRKKRRRLRSRIVEDISDELLPEMRKNQKLFIVIDSISGLMFESAMKADDGGKQMAMHASAQKWLTNKLLSELNPNVALFYIAQQSTNIAAYGAPMQANMGKAVRHYSTNIIKLASTTATSNVERDGDTKRILSQRVTWTIEKCKQNGAEGVYGDYWFNKETGKIEKTKEILHIAKRVGIIGGTGAWPEWAGEKYHGINALEAALTDDDYELMENTILSLAEIPLDGE